MDISKKMNFSPETFMLIMQRLSIIDSFKGSWNAVELSKSKHLKELRKIATIESIGSSTRIEGATLTDVEVEKLLKSVKITKLSSRDEEEVIGYYEVLQVILENFGELSLTENNLHYLHSLLLKHSHKDQHHKGKYKNLSNKVVANYPDGALRTIFNTTVPHLTAIEIQNLISWTNQKFKANDTHPLILISFFVYEFLSIHPYQDGNGRMSRLLTTLLMLREEYNFIQYVSFENLIEKKKNEYYRALMEGQKNRGTTSESLDQWILFFMDCMVTLTQRLNFKYNSYAALKKLTNDRQQEIFQLIKKNKRIKVGGIDNAFPLFSRNTIKKDLSFLLAEGLIKKAGAGRGVYYFV